MDQSRGKVAQPNRTQLGHFVPGKQCLESIVLLESCVANDEIVT